MELTYLDDMTCISEFSTRDPSKLEISRRTVPRIVSFSSVTTLLSSEESQTHLETVDVEYEMGVSGKRPVRCGRDR